MTNNNQGEFTSSGTDIDEVKRKNAESGLSYNEVKEMLAKKGGYGTAVYSDTNIEEVKKENQPRM
ncbi:gamma-type small acid-soluble spore protein [Solibacillus sp. FSL H8-0538]|uniref:gamma-type small acid-soluble spore protein n=1 Tax=Solibacillus sp. FSL H8-0538 TaxID=2921400 RepID=UPI0030F8DA70